MGHIGAELLPHSGIFHNVLMLFAGNPRVYKALKKELAAVLAELQRIEAGNGVDEELLNVIELIFVILGGLKGEVQDE